MHLVLEKTVLGQEAADELVRILHKIFNERCGMQLEIEAELPFPFAAFPGDRAELQLPRLQLAGTYEVVRARCRLDGEGERTNLVLSVR